MIPILSILILLLGQISGFTVSFLNINSADSTAVPILDNNGDPIALGSGFVAAGTFATLPGSINEVRTFTPFGEGNSIFSNTLGVGGFFDGNRSAPIPEGTADAPVNQSVYLVIGNGADLVSSTEFAVFDPGLVFGTENAVGFGALDIIIDSDALTDESLVYGTITTNVDTGLGVIFEKSIQLGQFLSYTTTDGKVTITDCDEAVRGELIIPDIIGGNPVTSIGENAFLGCASLTSVTIPESVTRIGFYAFRSCTSLTSVMIPDSVNSIESGVFWDCTNLTSITIPESVTNIGIRAFYNCASLTSITIPESVTSIEDNAFAFCSKLTSVTIPEGVTLLGRGAFIRCSSLINISVEEGNLNYSSIEGVLFTKSQNNLLFFPSGREGSYSIPDAVTSINSFAFDSCLLSEVIIPDGVASIGLKAFQYSSQLASIIIPEGVTSIEPETFRYATNLASVTLPSSLTTIGTKAFSMCSNLMEVVLEGPAPEVQSDAFTSIAEGAIALTRPKHIESYGGEGVSWEGLTIQEIPLPVLNLRSYYESLPDKTVSIDATANDGITKKYDYQWFLNDFPIPEFLGGTAAVQVINGIEESEGKWKVVVTNRFGEAEHSFDYRILVDTDEDGLSDGYEELLAGTNPELSDTDGDGLSDFDEIEAHNTNPLKDDSDGDGFLDGFEVANKSGPLVAKSQPNLTVEIALSDINGLPALKFETNPIVGGLITIEQSSDLKTWAPVVFFNGEGVAYETTVIRPPAAKSIYRLKVLDQTQ